MRQAADSNEKMADHVATERVRRLKLGALRGIRLPLCGIGLLFGGMSLSLSGTGLCDGDLAPSVCGIGLKRAGIESPFRATAVQLAARPAGSALDGV